MSGNSSLRYGSLPSCSAWQTMVPTSPPKSLSLSNISRQAQNSYQSVPTEPIVGSSNYPPADSDGLLDPALLDVSFVQHVPQGLFQQEEYQNSNANDAALHPPYNQSLHPNIPLPPSLDQQWLRTAPSAVVYAPSAFHTRSGNGISDGDIFPRSSGGPSGSQHEQSRAWYTSRDALQNSGEIQQEGHAPAYQMNRQHDDFHATETAPSFSSSRFPDVSSHEDVSITQTGTEVSEPAPRFKSKGKRKSMASASKDPAAKPAKKPRKMLTKRAAATSTLANADALPQLKPSLEGLVAPSNWRKLDGLRGPSPPQKSSGDFFDSFEEATEAMLAPSWTPSAADVVPQTNEELRPHMRNVRDAMKNMSHFKDKNENSSLQKRWLDSDYEAKGENGAVLSNTFYMPHILEWLAWKIVHMCQQLHLHGPGAIGNQEPLILEASFQDANLTFNKRIAMLVDVCLQYKSRVTAMLEGGSLERYVLTPSSLLPGSAANAKANIRRQDQIKDGRSLWAKKNPDIVLVETARRYQITQVDGEPAKDGENETSYQANETVTNDKDEGLYDLEIQALEDEDRSAYDGSLDSKKERCPDFQHMHGSPHSGDQGYLLLDQVVPLTTSTQLGPQSSVQQVWSEPCSTQRLQTSSDRIHTQITQSPEGERKAVSQSGDGTTRLASSIKRKRQGHDRAEQDREHAEGTALGKRRRRN